VPTGREWTHTEFEFLLLEDDWPAQTLSEAVGTRRDPVTGVIDQRRHLERTVEEIEDVRAAIHAWHTDGDTSGLTPLMLEHLKPGTDERSCAVCGAGFGVSLPRPSA
jgi:hypothetical protein